MQIEEKKSFLKNDTKLVCGMLVFYGLCILGLIGATIWGLDKRSKTLSRNATSTAYAVSTQKANASATAIVRRVEQDQYDSIDHFESNRNRWRIGSEDSEYWRGETGIDDGIYLWEIQETKDTFVSWADYTTNDRMKDFDVYVDTEVVEGGSGAVCSGLIFRKSPAGWDEGGYYFSLCNNGVVNISYHTGKDGWERIKTIPYFNISSDWNRLELSARGSHFLFFINGQQIYEMDDDRQKIGGLALVVELSQNVPAKVAFDNFGYQSR